MGHRFLGGAPGVYCHNDGMQHKAEGYMRWVPLCLDGVFWAAKFEVLVDRNHRVKVARKTDQWAQEMHEGDGVSLQWKPELEASTTTAEAARKPSPEAEALAHSKKVPGVKVAASGFDFAATILNPQGSTFGMTLAEHPSGNEITDVAPTGPIAERNANTQEEGTKIQKGDIISSRQWGLKLLKV